MKKNLMRSMFVLLTAIISFQFISCSDDDDPQTPPQEENLTAEVRYYIDDMKDLFSLVDITVDYTDENGDIQTEAVTSLPWKKELPTVEVPFNPSMTIYYKMKEGIQFDQTSYELLRSYSIRVDTKATVTEEGNATHQFHTKLNAETAKAEIQRLEENPDKVSCEIKKSQK